MLVFRGVSVWVFGELHSKYPLENLQGFIHAAAGAHGFRVNAGPVHVPLKNPNDQNYVVKINWNGNDTGETILYIIKLVFLYGLVVNDDNQWVMI